MNEPVLLYLLQFNALLFAALLLHELYSRNRGRAPVADPVLQRLPRFLAAVFGIGLLTAHFYGLSDLLRFGFQLGIWLITLYQLRWAHVKFRGYWWMMGQEEVGGDGSGI